jgi:hypothetical protein
MSMGLEDLRFGPRADIARVEIRNMSCAVRTGARGMRGAAKRRDRSWEIAVLDDRGNVRSSRERRERGLDVERLPERDERGANRRGVQTDRVVSCCQPDGTQTTLCRSPTAAPNGRTAFSRYARRAILSNPHKRPRRGRECDIGSFKKVSASHD